jgi:hypothetical protein
MIDAVAVAEQLLAPKLVPAGVAGGHVEAVEVTGPGRSGCVWEAIVDATRPLVDGPASARPVPDSSDAEMRLQASGPVVR